MAVDTLPSASRPLREVYLPVRPAGAATGQHSIAGRSLTLPRGQIYTIPSRLGIGGIEVLHGTLWLTATPADRDVILQAGDLFPLGPNAPFILEALADTEFMLHR